jgi:hypothetical protein
MASVVRCGNCKALLAEPSDMPPEQRVPCPNCGSTSRQFEKNLTATVVTTGVATDDVTVTAPAAEAGATAAEPQIKTEQLEHAGFDVQWLQLSPGGAWMVRVFDRQGNWIDGSVQDDATDAILAVCERLLPVDKST